MKHGNQEELRNLPAFVVIRGKCLGYSAYRGFARLKDLAEISKADIFDQAKNPLGTQRNLSTAHARSAYRYVAESENAFYPEIVLNLRDSSYVRIEKLHAATGATLCRIVFEKDPRKVSKTVVSRLDGNHRLWLADGNTKNFPAIDRPVSFCLLEVNDLRKELELFRDINDNQMGMNTSHLQNITARLLGEKALKVTKPALYIVQKLQKDKNSPLYQKLHEGGKIRKGATLTGLSFANLVNAVQDMLSRSAKLSQFPDADAQYGVIRNFWVAVKRWLPGAWTKPSDYIIFKGVGLYAISYLGVEIIDRCLVKGKFESNHIYAYLKKLPDPEVFRARKGIAYAGRSGGRKLANDLIADLEEEGEISLTKLQRLILDSQST